MPTLEAWEAFAGVCVVIILLGGVALALQRLGIIGQKRTPAPAPADSKPSPETLALIESTQALVNAVTVMAERTETMGRVHYRLDEVNNALATNATEVAELKGQLVAMNATMRLIEQHLMGSK